MLGLSKVPGPVPLFCRDSLSRFPPQLHRSIPVIYLFVFSDVSLFPSFYHFLSFGRLLCRVTTCPSHGKMSIVRQDSRQDWNELSLPRIGTVIRSLYLVIIITIVAAYPLVLIVLLRMEIIVLYFSFRRILSLCTLDFTLFFFSKKW